MFPPSAETTSMITPPKRCSVPSTLSVAKKRSATKPRKNGADNGGNGIDGVWPVREVSHALRGHVVSDRDVPCAPDKEL